MVVTSPGAQVVPAWRPTSRPLQCEFIKRAGRFAPHGEIRAESKIAEAIALELPSVAVLFTNAKPETATEFKEGSIGFFDISQHSKVSRDVLTYTKPFRLDLEMEDCVEESLLGTDAWLKLEVRQ